MSHYTFLTQYFYEFKTHHKTHPPNYSQFIYILSLSFKWYFLYFNKYRLKLGKFLQFEDEPKKKTELNFNLAIKTFAHSSTEYKIKLYSVCWNSNSVLEFSSVKMKQPTSMNDTLYLIFRVYLLVSHLRFS